MSERGPRAIAPYSREWLRNANLTSSGTRGEITVYMQDSASLVLGKLFDSHHWSSIMRDRVRTPDPSQVEYNRDTRYARSALRIMRTLSDQWEVGGEDPRFRYIATRVYLLAEEQRRAPSGATEKLSFRSGLLKKGEVALFLHADSKGKEEMLKKAEERARGQRSRERRKARERDKALIDYASDKGIDVKQRERLDDIAHIFFVDETSQLRAI